MRIKGWNVGVLVVAALMLSGCTLHHVTETENGHTVTSSPVAKVPDVDACGALTDATIDTLGLSDVKPQKLTDPAKPGCQWEGINDYVTPTVTLWVLDPSTIDPSDDNVTVSGVKVNVWAMNDTGGRYVVPCGKVSLAVNYTQAKNSPAVEDALQRSTKDVIAAYNCKS